MNHFHLRTNLPAPQAYDGERRAIKQEDAILETIRSMPERKFDCYDLLDRFPHWPITSIRRALTNLHKAGQLVPEGKQLGRMGVSVTLYRFAPPVNSQFTLSF